MAKPKKPTYVDKPRGKERKLSPRQVRLVDELFQNDMHKERAAAAAGYGSVKANAARLFENPAVMAEIEKRQAKMREKYELSEDWIIQRMMRIADAGKTLARFRKAAPDGSLYWDFTDATPEDLSVLTEMSVETYKDGRGDDAVDVKKFKIGIDSPKAALDSLMRKMGMFKDNVHVTGAMSFTERLQRGRDRIAAEKKGE